MADTDISDDAVRKATGRGWTDWFARLDDLGGADLGDHTARAAALSRAEPDLSGWWVQMVTVQYERERGLRAVHERSGGFGVSVQRTVDAPAEAAWAAVRDALLPGVHWREGEEGAVDGVPVTVRVVRDDRLRFWWHAPEGRSTVVVDRQPRGERTTLRVGHDGLPARGDVEVARARWRAALDRVAARLGA